MSAEDCMGWTPIPYFGKLSLPWLTVNEIVKYLQATSVIFQLWLIDDSKYR
jgi:hypothetical protein